MSNFYDTFFAEPMAERQRIAQSAGLSLPYIQKHTYTNAREPKFHFHNAVGLDRASNGKVCFLDVTEGDIDWGYVLERLRVLFREKRFGKGKIKPLPTTHFDAFWRSYPRKVNKPGALRSWMTQGCDRAAHDILADVLKRAKDEDWTKDRGRYIPHPATYLNQRRWEDEAVASEAGAFAGAL